MNAFVDVPQLSYNLVAIVWISQVLLVYADMVLVVGKCVSLPLEYPAFDLDDIRVLGLELGWQLGDELPVVVLEGGDPRLHGFDVGEGSC